MDLWLTINFRSSRVMSGEMIFIMGSMKENLIALVTHLVIVLRGFFGEINTRRSSIIQVVWIHN